MNNHIKGLSFSLLLRKVSSYVLLTVNLSKRILHALTINYALLWTGSQGAVNINKFFICLVLLAEEVPKNNYNVNYCF